MAQIATFYTVIFCFLYYGEVFCLALLKKAFQNPGKDVGLRFHLKKCKNVKIHNVYVEKFSRSNSKKYDTESRIESFFFQEKLPNFAPLFLRKCCQNEKMSFLLLQLQFPEFSENLIQ